MKKLYVNGKVVKVYDSIDEMPIVNFQKYNKYLLIDSGIGSDIDDIDQHIVKIAKFIKTDNRKALQELQNMRQNIAMINSEISPKYMAFAALIHSINGREITDLSDDNLKEVLADLKKVKHSTIVNFLLWLKKKVTTELETYFPGDFTSPKEKEIYDKFKARVLLVLDSIITDSDHKAEIESIEDSIMDTYKPRSFIGSSSVEITYDKQFENACLVISQKTNLSPKSMTVLQFYNAMDNIKQQTEAELKHLKSNKRR